MSRRQIAGKRAYLKGKAAEEQVLRQYQDAGCTLLARRWRGPFGEIDLVFAEGTETVFVEVKSAATHALAAAALTPRQRARLLASAEACLGWLPQGALSPMRFDLALVDGRGVIEVLPGALQA
jgi:putative endonuclease